jgi:DNA primase
LVLDLDPPSADGFRLAVQAALLVRQVLADAGLADMIKTSGAKGLHVFVPIEARETIDEVAATTRGSRRAPGGLQPARAARRAGIVPAGLGRA